MDDWTAEQLVERARWCIVGAGERLDREVFDRFAARLSHVQGAFGDAATHDSVGAAIKAATRPVFYIEIPPFLFSTVVKGWLMPACPSPGASSWRSRSATIVPPPER